MINWSNFVKTSETRTRRTKRAVCYEKSFNNPAMYPETSKPRIVRTTRDISLEELLEIEQQLMNDPRRLRQLEIKRRLEQE